VSPAECSALGWDSLDIILVTGDAYIDHPAFGIALLARFLLSHGYRVGIIAQPVSDSDFQKLGRPKLFFGISAGNMDSMVNHYTAQKKLRSEDAYSPNGQTGLRPDRATLIYTQKVKQFMKGIPVVIGGVEASMRRIPHFDFWTDKIRNSYLIESKASILVYGNGERQILEIARRIAGGDNLYGIYGTCIMSVEKPADAIELTEYATVSKPENFYRMTKLFFEHSQSNTLYYKHLERYYIHHPPADPLTTREIDTIYDLPFAREPHPIYQGKRIKAFDQIKLSITSHRGCYGGCSFCMIGFHQGKTIQSRSRESIMSEIASISDKTYFRGTITDIAGPSANMYGTECREQTHCSCYSCLHPTICPKLNLSDKKYISVLRSAKQVRKVSNIFISSGVRFDLAIQQPDFMQELCIFHTSGQLKLAPEHVSKNTLKRMRKPEIDKFLKFSEIFYDLSKKIEKKQFIIPYIIVGFPGTTRDDALQLANFLKKHKITVEQIQEFTPTPMTIATMSYFTGIDFDTGENIYIPKGREIREQKNLLL
jgi:uncharacterized radical SAM protein YgiQ